MFHRLRKAVAILALAASLLALQLADSPGWHEHTQPTADCLLCLGSVTGAVAALPVIPLPAVPGIRFLSPAAAHQPSHTRSIYPIRGSPLA